MAINTHPCPNPKKHHSRAIDVDPVPLSPKTIRRIEEAKRDLKEGNVCTLEELKAELGIE